MSPARIAAPADPEAGYIGNIIASATLPPLTWVKAIRRLAAARVRRLRRQRHRSAFARRDPERGAPTA
jgi:hypothetical protein